MSSDVIQSPRRKKLFAVADDLGLTREERVELAQYLLRRDVTSWGQLSEEQVSRMLDALEGYELVTALLALRPAHEEVMAGVAHRDVVGLVED